MTINDLYEYSTPIENFPNYEVSNYGRVYNIRTGREMTLSPTQFDELTVGLTRGGRQYRRSVKVLVARAFVPGESEFFDTPVLLDGDRNNLTAENIVWRPRWFAWRYIHQFQHADEWKFHFPLQEVFSGDSFPNIYEAGITNGSLFADVYLSVMNDRKTFPGGEKYFHI